jgi:hypothetical protein
VFGGFVSENLTTAAPEPAVAPKSSIGVDPMNQVERAQAVFEKGPIAAVAAFFVVAFFISLYFLLRAKDKHQASQSRLQADHAREIARITEKHSDEMSALYTDERDRAIKHEVTMSNYLDMMEDVRFIAFEMRRVKMARERKTKPTNQTGEFEAVKGDPDGGKE